jgi:hypothetical protein
LAGPGKETIEVSVYEVVAKGCGSVSINIRAGGVKAALPKCNSQRGCTAARRIEHFRCWCKTECGQAMQYGALNYSELYVAQSIFSMQDDERIPPSQG